MQLTIDRGLQSFEIFDADGTAIGTVRFNPADVGMLGRLDEARKTMEEAEAAASAAVARQGDDAPGAIAHLCAQIREAFDYAFGAPVSGVLFAGVSPLAICDDGACLCEHVLESFAPVIEEAQAAAIKASNERISKHAGAYQGSAVGLAPGQSVKTPAKPRKRAQRPAEAAQ